MEKKYRLEYENKVSVVEGLNNIANELAELNNKLEKVISGGRVKTETTGTVFRGIGRRKKIKAESKRRYE